MSYAPDAATDGTPDAPARPRRKSIAPGQLLTGNALDSGHLKDRLPKRASFDGAYPPELQAKALADWGAYGYPYDAVAAE